VAERVLSVEELQGYVDRECPAPPPRKPAPNAASAGVETADQVDGFPPHHDTSAEGLRYLLARRLARAYRFAEARPYYPAKWLQLFDQLSAAWRDAENTALPQLRRGQALLQAAVLTRKHGLELIGTEVEPDWRIHAGDFRQGVSVAERASLAGTNCLAASGAELRRAVRHSVQPERRWHYRAVATVIGWEAAALLSRAETPGQTPAERAQMLLAAGATLKEHGISYIFALKPGSVLHAAQDASATSLASRVSHTLAKLSAEDDMELPEANSSTRLSPEALWERGLTFAALAWEAAQRLPNNSDETARLLCRSGRWLSGNPPVADIFYKALVGRCRKTAIGAEADRLHWFPQLDEQGNLIPRETRPAPAAQAEDAAT
jgi:hypothetical protein